jgi:hypothetical protein
MTLYSTVDEGYEVEIHRSLASLWSSVKGENRFLDRAGRTPLNEKTLAAALRQGTARIYEDEARDWCVKIQRH